MKLLIPVALVLILFNLHFCRSEKNSTDKIVWAEGKIAETELREYFKIFDTDKNGMMSAQEMKAFFAKMGDKHTDEEMNALVSYKGKDGYLDVNQFVKLFLEE